MTTDTPFHDMLRDLPGRLAIIGAGGLGREVLCLLGDALGWEGLDQRVVFAVEPAYGAGHRVHGIDVIPIDFSRPSFEAAVLAIGDLPARMRIAAHLDGRVDFRSVIHPSAVVTPFTRLGEGAIVLAHVHISCDVTIGRHAILNPGTTVSHDSAAGDFFFAAPGAVVSGHCHMGDRVFIGAGAALRNGVRIASDVVIGAGAAVVGNIDEPGTYIGVPARRR
jgi:sugar O-acyltransferase (sialic acid O-acetyltransferase NeuD family)